MIGVSLANLNCSFSTVLGLEMPRNKLNFSLNRTLLNFSVFFMVCRHFADKKALLIEELFFFCRAKKMDNLNLLIAKK